MEIMHFNSQKERLDYLKGNYEEIIPQKAEEAVEEKPKKKKSSKKKEKKDDAVQAE